MPADPFSRTLVRESWPIPAGAYHGSLLVAPVCDGTGAGNDDDAGGLPECGIVRHFSVTDDLDRHGDEPVHQRPCHVDVLLPRSPGKAYHAVGDLLGLKVGLHAGLANCGIQGPAGAVLTDTRELGAFRSAASEHFVVIGDGSFGLATPDIETEKNGHWGHTSITPSA